jgi:dephospho-CoA kinase
VTRTVIGLTGSIGMGKSTTAAMFADRGIPVWDADAAVHRIYAAGGPGGSALSDVVPDAVLDDGSVSRERLRAALRDHPGLLDAIEARIHPLVARDRAAFLEENTAADIVVLDIPLLFETGGTRLVDRVAVVSTSPEEQRSRVLSRPGMNEEAFERFLSRQLPDRDKRAHADFVIRTDDLATARADVEHLLNQIRSGKEYARNRSRHGNDRT